jgi:hypothetical protein
MHMHILIGGISEADLIASLYSWPGDRDVRKVYNRFGAIHYILTQTRKGKPKTAGHLDSDAIVGPCYLESDNLALWEDAVWAARARARSLAGRNAVNVRWARRRSDREQAL